jgi:hypothetical protein
MYKDTLIVLYIIKTIMVNEAIDTKVNLNIKHLATPEIVLHVMNDSEKYTIKVNPYDSILQILHKINLCYNSDHHYTENSLFFRDIEMAHTNLLIDYFPYWNNNKTFPIYTVFLQKSIDIAKNYKQPPFASKPNSIVPYLTSNEMILKNADDTLSEIHRNKHKLIICGYLSFLSASTLVLMSAL